MRMTIISVAAIQSIVLLTASSAVQDASPERPGGLGPKTSGTAAGAKPAALEDRSIAVLKKLPCALLPMTQEVADDVLPRSHELSATEEEELNAARDKLRQALADPPRVQDTRSGAGAEVAELIDALAKSRDKADVDLLSRATRYSNNFVGTRAAETLWEWGVRRTSIAGYEYIALDVQDSYICYQVRAASHLVNLGRLEWLEVLVRYAGMGVQYSEEARGSLERFTGLCFANNEGWRAWWQGVREGRTVTDSLVLSDKQHNVYAVVKNLDWYKAATAMEPKFEKRFFSTDGGEPGGGVFRWLVGAFNEQPALQEACLRWYLRHPDLRLRGQSIKHLWERGVVLRKNELPDVFIDAWGRELRHTDRESLDSMRKAAVIDPSPHGLQSPAPGWALVTLNWIGDPMAPALAIEFGPTQNNFTRWSAADTLCHYGYYPEARVFLGYLVEKQTDYYSQLANERLKALKKGSFVPLNLDRAGKTTLNPKNAHGSSP